MTTVDDVMEKAEAYGHASYEDVDDTTPLLVALRSAVEAAIADAVAGERERCALIVRNAEPGSSYRLREYLEDAIRARTKEQT